MSASSPPDDATTLHATCIALDRRAALILGPAGSGKSGLALRLMAMGAVLVSDDQTSVRRMGADLLASAPAAIRGRIEARGVGLLTADTVADVPIRLLIDLGETETHRLPPERDRDILGCKIPLVYGVESAHFSAAILQLLKAGRCA